MRQERDVEQVDRLEQMPNLRRPLLVSATLRLLFRRRHLRRGDRERLRLQRQLVEIVVAMQRQPDLPRQPADLKGPQRLGQLRGAVAGDALAPMLAAPDIRAPGSEPA